ncbi:MAG: branched-chain amino acid transaminase [Patescibacteria group bacterium]
MKYWLDGKIVNEQKAKIPLLTHSLHYGSAVFEGIRFYKTDNGSAVFRLRDHLKRLFYSAEVMGMKLPFSIKKTEEAVLETIRVNRFQEGYIRPLIYFGNKMGLDPQGADVHLVIAAWPWGKYLNDKVRVKISSFIRIHHDSTDVRAKISGHYVNSILATSQARRVGFDEALLLDVNKKVAEGAGENIFFVKNNNIITPKSGSILPGLTRDTVMILVKEMGYKVIEKSITPSDLKNFDEAFFTGTAAEVTMIKSIDKHIFKQFTVSEQIKEKYDLVVRGQDKKYKKWLTKI